MRFTPSFLKYPPQRPHSRSIRTQETKQQPFSCGSSPYLSWWYPSCWWCPCSQTPHPPAPGCPAHLHPLPSRCLPAAFAHHRPVQLQGGGEQRAGVTVQLLVVAHPLKNTHVHICTELHDASTHIQIHTPSYRYTGMQTYTYTHLSICTHIYTHIYTYTQT